VSKITITSRGDIAKNGTAIGYILGQTAWLFEDQSGKCKQTIKQLAGIEYFMIAGQLKKGQGTRV